MSRNGAVLADIMPTPLRLALDAVTVDDQPYGVQPHSLTQQNTSDRVVVWARPTSSWHRIELAIG